MNHLSDKSKYANQHSIDINNHSSAASRAASRARKSAVEYLKEHGIREKLCDLTRKLALHQPSNPLDFLSTDFTTVPKGKVRLTLHAAQSGRHRVRMLSSDIRQGDALAVSEFEKLVKTQVACVVRGGLSSISLRGNGLGGQPESRPGTATTRDSHISVQVYDAVRSLLQDSGVLDLLTHRLLASELLQHAAASGDSLKALSAVREASAKDLARAFRAGSEVCDELGRIIAQACRKETSQVKAAKELNDMKEGKFAHLPEGNYGDIKVFLEGLGKLGMPLQRPRVGMKFEFTEGADSDDKFTGHNTKPNTTTPRLEWQFVLEPFEDKPVDNPRAWTILQKDYSKWKGKQLGTLQNRTPIRVCPSKSVVVFPQETCMLYACARACARPQRARTHMRTHKHKH